MRLPATVKKCNFADYYYYYYMHYTCVHADNIMQYIQIITKDDIKCTEVDLFPEIIIFEIMRN